MTGITVIFLAKNTKKASKKHKINIIDLYNKDKSREQAPKRKQTVLKLDNKDKCKIRSD